MHFYLQITDAAIGSVVSGLHELENVDLRGCKQVCMTSHRISFGKDAILMMYTARSIVLVVVRVTSITATMMTTMVMM